MSGFFHNSLNEDQTNELFGRMSKAKSDTMRVYELSKSFDTLWRWKAYHLHREIYRYEMQETVIGRALNDLCAMGYIVDTGEKVKSEKGAPNIIYRIAEVEPINPIKIPKSISSKLNFIEKEDGSVELDWDTMLNEFITKFEYYDKIFKTK